MQGSKSRLSLKKAQGGFTLIEILVVIGIIAVLAAIVIIAINPARQFAQARDTQRSSNLNAILNAVGQRTADNKGIFAGDFTAVDGSTKHCPVLPTTAKTILTDMSDQTGTSVGLGCLVPTYISALPSDPKAVTPNTNTEYFISATSSRIQVEGGNTTNTQELDIPRPASSPIIIIR
jgi:type IV pilus assembly protein PilA